ncbi:MAG: glycoside hydrolase family 43 [Brevundimonas sp.]|uniref:glycoside hydrolase family 43 n=1 Tax=Brevundimonas sp. TaxID=1871086 RepID=UPI0027337844|nr:glycoside hydrolase family 43 [Brevundimonas sp.]MDP3406255.1 glycoside hydrolase family 43 [Brevundimonas sp.]
MTSALVLAATLALAGQTADSGALYRDPVHDGAADASIVAEPGTGRWLMFYTNRRADLTGPDDRDVSWVHGTRIGVAASTDQGASWTYQGTADLPAGAPTHWAPDIVRADGLHHMFLTVVPGVFSDWNAPRAIVHLTSKDLTHWVHRGRLDLGSDRVIDAGVLALPGGGWRMWYKDERDASRIHAADSPDLDHWTPRGGALDGPAGEGPKPFVWRGRYWMIVDHWNGLGVYHSTDAEQWQAQPGRLLAEPGARPTDRAKGQHADVVVAGDRAFLFYFTHQDGAPETAGDPTWRRRSVIHAAELIETDGILSVDRNQPVTPNLGSPQ